MYGLLWRIPPGPVWLKVIEALILIVAIIAVLFVWVFPTVAPLLPFDQQTVEQP